MGDCRPFRCHLWRHLLDHYTAAWLLQRICPAAPLWWDSLDQTYFAGYALWNYLVFPALLLREDIRWQEAGPNRLLAAFPGNIPTHSPVQEFLFDPASGLLRQHNYTAEVMGGWAKAANVIVEHGVWNGIPYPSHRRVTPRKKDGSPSGGPVLIDLVIHNWSVSS